MLHAVGNYLYERRQGLTKAGTYLGTTYLLSRYVSERIDDVRSKLLHDRMARENLRKRFDQNQQDVAFTIMALLPTLGTHILDGMDVESLTQELQSQSKPKPKTEATHPLLRSPPQPSESSLTSSIEPLSPNPEQDARSDSGSMSVISFSGQDEIIPSSDAGTSSSWVDQFSTSQPSEAASLTSSFGLHPPPHPDSPKSNGGTDLSESMISSVASYGDVHGVLEQEVPPPDTYIRSKAELWKEVKMLTFTRTLTIMYSMTLLTLLTHIQLNILGRHKYVQSILQLAHDEKQREKFADSLSIANLLFGGGRESEEDESREVQEVENISEETERKYLTLSWWILHVGWKDVGERVKRGVEEVFEGVSLKTKLSASDLHRLVSDVRRRVEFEVTFEGKERRINFSSTLLPPTSETLHHLLTQGGIPSRVASAGDPAFDRLLEETRKHLTSRTLEVVLEECLDRSTEILFNGLEKNVFGSEGDDGNVLGLVQEPRVRLAGVLPGLARWGHLALEGLPNELIDGLGSLREVQALSAIIYSSYDDWFQ